MTRKQLAVPLVAALLGGAVTAAAIQAGGTGTEPSMQGLLAVSSGDGRLSAREIFDRAAPGVVYIRAQPVQPAQASAFDAAAQNNELAVSTGSGFVLDDEGRVVTNAHVVSGVADVQVTFADGRTVPARVLGKDEETDLALLGVEPKGLDLRPLELGSSKNVHVGDPTISIGNPFGRDRTLTTGVVSAKQRRITAPSGFSVDNVIQTDGVLNPGNAGGPLLDAAGRVIGVNSQIEAEGPQGEARLGFAVPIDTAKALIPSLQAHRNVSHAYLGIAAGDGPRALVSLGAGRSGVRVREVDPEGPAARAGILGDGSVAGGDVIVSVDGEPVDSMADVDDVVSRHRPGDGLPIVLERNGSRLTVQVMLSERPASVPLG
jgi:S1-C subfamily serine protease